MAILIMLYVKSQDIEEFFITNTPLYIKIGDIVYYNISKGPLQNDDIKSENTTVFDADVNHKLYVRATVLSIDTTKGVCKVKPEKILHVDIIEHTVKSEYDISNLKNTGNADIKINNLVKDIENVFKVQDNESVFKLNNISDHDVLNAYNKYLLQSKTTDKLNAELAGIARRSAFAKSAKELRDSSNKLFDTVGEIKTLITSIKTDSETYPTQTQKLKDILKLMEDTINRDSTKLYNKYSSSADSKLSDMGADLTKKINNMTVDDDINYKFTELLNKSKDDVDMLPIANALNTEIRNLVEVKSTTMPGIHLSDKKGVLCRIFDDDNNKFLEDIIFSQINTLNFLKSSVKLGSTKRFEFFGFIYVTNQTNDPTPYTFELISSAPLQFIFAGNVLIDQISGKTTTILSTQTSKSTITRQLTLSNGPYMFKIIIKLKQTENEHLILRWQNGSSAPYVVIPSDAFRLPELTHD